VRAPGPQRGEQVRGLADPEPRTRGPRTPTTPRDVTEIVRSGLCSGCGLCASLAGPAKIRMGLNMKGNMRPLVLDRVDDDTNRTILASCPGTTVTGPGTPAGARTHPVWGPIRAMHRSWSAEPEVRHHAAAGGTLTGLGRYLLDSGSVSAVLHVRASEETPWLTEAQVSRSAADVYSGAQSRYGPAAPLVHVRALLDAGERFAVIAKPCDVSALRSLARVDPRVDEQIPYMLTLFCGGVFNAHIPRAVIRYHGVAESDVTTFRFRGDGWPGPLRVGTDDGRTFDLPYASAYTGRPWGYDMQFRCKICPDAVGEVADISAPDGWVLADGKPVYDEAPGRNVAVVRTERGRELLAAAVAAGYIELSPVSMDELEAMHGNHPARKVGAPATFLALRVSRQPRPAVRGYRTWHSVRRAGLRTGWQQFRGTLRRVLRGDNREPVI
jgi:coenzyme F420 hydrogenase subunit beta